MMLTVCCYRTISPKKNIGNRNGSSACTIISLLVGYSGCKRAYTIEDISDMFDRVVPVFVGSMELGNILYEWNQCTGYLTPAEAIGLLPEPMGFAVKAEQSWLMSAGNLQKLYLFTEQYIIQQPRNFAVYISRGETKCIFPVGSLHLALTDSHSHSPYGAEIKTAKTEYLDQLLRSIFVF